jgi:hypothetical protein
MKPEAERGFFNGIELWRSSFPIKKAQFSPGKGPRTSVQHHSLRIAELSEVFGFTVDFNGQSRWPVVRPKASG